VFIVVDGRDKMHETLLKYCEADLRLFDSDMLRLQHRNNDVTAHIFQRTVLFARPDGHGCYDPLQLCLVVKEKNGGKLNSHLWFFSGFMPQLEPHITFVRTLVCLSS
jgi:cellulose synthase/poly-beta-1,6-N-acetylglucosamine synthase-like glycosyltransferase